jgi:hypothetical protein
LKKIFLQKTPTYKHSSLFWICVNEKILQNVVLEGAPSTLNKLSYSQILGLAEKLAWDKHSSLLCLNVEYQILVNRSKKDTPTLRWSCNTNKHQNKLKCFLCINTLAYFANVFTTKCINPKIWLAVPLKGG